MFKKYFFLLILLFLPTELLAQGQQRNPCFVNSEGGCTSVGTANPLPVNATVNASINTFHQESVLAPFTATTGGVSSPAFTAGKTIVVTNAGISNMAYCQLGTGATTASQPIAPNGGWAAFSSTSETQVTCATSTSTTTINVSVGTGLPTGVGGAFGAATNASIGNTGAAVPAFATYLGINSGGNLTGWNGAVTANAGTNLNTSALALESGNLATIVSQLGAVTASPTAFTINDRLKTINTTLGSPFQAGGSIGNTAFGISGTLPAFASTPTFNLGTISTAASAANQTAVIGSAGAGSAAASSLLMGSLYVATPPTKTDGQQSALLSDASGNLKVNVVAGGGSGGTSSSFGSAFPSTGTAIGFSDGANMVAGTVDGSGFIKVNCASGCSGGTFNNNADGVATSSTNGQAAAWLYGWNGTTFDRLRTDTTNGLWVNVKTSALPTGAATSAKQPALGTAGSASTDVLTVQGIASMTALKVDGTGGTFPVSGTVAATQSGTWTVQPGNTANTTAWLVTGTGGTFPITAASGSVASGAISSGAFASGAIGSGAVASGAFASGSVASGAYASGSLASGAVVDLTNLSTPITPATATATKATLLGMQYNSTQATFTNTQQGAVQGTSRGALYVATGADTFTVAVASMPSNSSVNVAQINGVTPLMGNGATGTGSQRVTLASDGTAISTTGYMSVKFDQTTPGTTNGVYVGGVAATATVAPVSTMNNASGSGALPSATAAVFDDTSPTAITENNFGYVRMSANRNLYGTIRDAAGGERGANVNAEFGLNVSAVASATNGSTTAGAIQPNNTTAVVVKASAGTLYGVQLANIGSGPAYLKIYNATSATCGSGTPVKRLIIPKAGTAADGGGSNVTFGPTGVAFGTGITYCVTTGITDSDTTAAASNTVLINVDYK